MVSTIFQFRRDTSFNWTNNNPILMSGEMGLETDTGKFKLGNGSAHWTNLIYASGPAGIQGVQGAIGPQGISFIWEGTWISLHSYVPGNCVNYGNGLYACINAVSSSATPDIDTTNWGLMLTQINADWNASSGASQILNKPVPYKYTQGVSANTWAITHNLNTYPTVVVVDNSGSTIIGEIHYDSMNQCTLYFGSPFSGIAILE